MTITLGEAKVLLRRVCEENPDSVNPQNYEGTCLYNRDPEGPDGAEHCIAGTAFIMLGIEPWRLEEETNASELGVALEVISPDDVDVRLLFDKVQNIADGGMTYVSDNNPAHDPRPWGRVLELAGGINLL